MQKTRYLILGGGMVAGYAAKELASQGLRPGELTIVSADSVVPYERPPLSKGFLSGKDKQADILINSPDWYRENGIEVRLNTLIEQVDTGKKQLRSNTGEEFECEHLLLATGARARKLDCPGNDLGSVFYLRSLKDSEAIRSSSASAKTAAVIGGGFIGMEVASVLAQKNIQTTLIIREDRVWSRVFTPAMSVFFEKYYTARGVRLVKQAAVVALEGKETVKAVRLDNREEISCDLVVVGVGAVPVTELLERTAVAVENGIVVNEFLESSCAGIYAAGDIANYPDSIFRKRRRVEHWDNAVSQGQQWARIVLGERQPFVHVPYFFSDVFDLSYELWGDAAGANDVVVRGDTNTSSFSVWWLKDKQLVATFAMNRPDEEREVAPEWIKVSQTVSAERLSDKNRPVREAVPANDK
ncbi:MAG TPA: FAD-dependent oxidoreductase [Terriglobales bacterium]|nr:FAD-dependent oxidoreductase [Terriglobales bacterium]